MDKKELLVVGAGAGGTILANTIDKSKFNVTIIDKSDVHIFQPQYLYVAFTGSQNRMSKKEESLLAGNVKFVQDEVLSIDLNERNVKTRSGKMFTYDYIVIATGIKSNPSSISGVEEVNKQFGDYHTSFDQASKVWSSLQSFTGGTIALGQSYPLCKCPPSPLEGIFLTEEFIKKKGLKDKTRLVFFTPYPRPYPAEGINEEIEPLLKERGIEVMTFFDVDRIDTANRIIYSIEGDTIKYDLPIIIPPCSGIDINYTPENVLDKNKLVLVDKYTMKVKGFDNAFAIGDGAALPTAKSGVGAHLEAKVVARILEGKDAKFEGRTNCPFDTGYNKGTFVIGSYTEPVIKYPINRLNLFMKHLMAKIYWQTLKGTFDEIFDLYFKETRPEKLEKKYGKKQ